MKLILLSIALPLSIALVGCETTGLSSREQGGQYATFVTALYQDQPSGWRQPVSLRVPAHIAVAQIGEVTPSRILLERLEQEPQLISRISPLPFPGEKQPRYYSSGRNETSSEELKKQATGLRNLAREMGAEYLLITGGNIDSYETRNPAAALDLTIVGAAVVPGTRISSEGKGAAALLDVETGRVIFLVSSELNKSSLSPTFFSDSKRTKLNRELRDELIGKLSEEFLQRLQTSTATRR
ncbi:MAG: hypothetical protein H0X66_13265 [Verrucomicrobia bacterium]|nr:hypothetical protein [Verrucomicrobiota bacterium]